VVKIFGCAKELAMRDSATLEILIFSGTPSGGDQ
jgi:hypothetical protein